MFNFILKFTYFACLLTYVSTTKEVHSFYSVLESSKVHLVKYCTKVQT